MKKEQNQLLKKKLKTNLKNSSNILLKVFIPELDLDAEGLYFYIKDTDVNMRNKLVNIKNFIESKSNLLKKRHSDDNVV